MYFWYNNVINMCPLVFTVGEGWGVYFSVMTTYNHVGRSFSILGLSVTRRDVWIIPYFRILDYVLHVEHVLSVIRIMANSIESSLFISRIFCLDGRKHCQKTLSMSLDLSSKVLLFPVTFLIFWAILISLLSSGWAVDSEYE